jgi:hypothetical protein
MTIGLGAGGSAFGMLRPTLSHVEGSGLALSALALCVLIGSVCPQAQAQPPRPAVAAAQPPQPHTQVETAARDALTQYSAALESLDAEQVKKIHPAVDVELLRRAFRDMRELKVTIDNVKVLSTEGATARVSCRVTQSLTPKIGQKTTNVITRVLRLRKQEAAWLIDGFER